MFSLINQSNFMVTGEKANNMTHSFLMEALKYSDCYSFKLTFKFTWQFLLCPASQQPTQVNQGAGFSTGEMKEEEIATASPNLNSLFSLIFN